MLVDFQIMTVLVVRKTEPGAKTFRAWQADAAFLIRLDTPVPLNVHRIRGALVPSILERTHSRELAKAFGACLAYAGCGE